MSITFRVRGQHVVRRAPERATVHLNLHAESAEKGPAAGEAVTGAAAVVRERLAPRTEVAEVAVGQLRMWSQPGDTAEAPTREIAECEVRVSVTDFTELGELLLGLAVIDVVNVGWIDWQLHDGTRRDLERQARIAALAEARSRAEDYAGALGVADLAVVLVADAGMMMSTGPHPMAFASKAMGAVADDFFTPQELEVNAEVEVEFRAG